MIGSRSLPFPVRSRLFLRAVTAIGVAAVFAVPGGAWAGLGDVQDGQQRGRVVPSDAVGSLAYEAKVAGDGTAGVSVPLEFAGEIDDSGLSLDYSSTAPEGVVGVGFSIGGLSSVTLCRQTIARDGASRGIAFDGQDRLCLDGERLVGIAGAYGSDGTVYGTRADDGTRVVQHGALLAADSSFEIRRRDGSKQIYGGTPNARVLAHRAPQGSRPATEVVWQWWVSEAENLAGEVTSFSYAKTVGEDGQIDADQRLTAVRYGAVPAAGIPAGRSVKLSYWTGEDLYCCPTAAGFLGGFSWSMKSLLRRVDFQVKGQPAGSVRLRYDGQKNENAKLEYHPKRRRLTGLVRYDGKGVAIPATELTWEQGTSTWKQVDGPHPFAATFYDDASEGWPQKPGSLAKHVFGDFDGDGDQDILAAPDAYTSQNDWDVWDAKDGSGAVSTGVPVAFQVPWQAELAVAPSWLRQRHVDVAVETVQLGKDAAQEVLVGAATGRVGGALARPPYGLGRKTAKDAGGEASSVDFHGHPGILDDVEVVQRDGGGTWSRTPLGWAQSPDHGHKLLYFQSGDFNADGRDDIAVCVSKVDFDAWYAKHGDEKQFDDNAQEAFLAGTLRYALADVDGNLSLANGGNPVDDGKVLGECSYDDWRYGADLSGDGRGSLLQVRARSVDGRVLELADRASTYQAWSLDANGWGLRDTHLNRDDFMRWREVGVNQAATYSPDGKKLLTTAPRFGFGIGAARLGDFNGDGLADAAMAQLAPGEDSTNQKHLDNGMGQEGVAPSSDEEKSGTRLWYGTGTGFRAGSWNLATEWYSYPWEWILGFSATAAVADMDGDGLDDLVRSRFDGAKKEWVWDAEKLTWIPDPEATDDDTVQICPGTSTGLGGCAPVLGSWSANWTGGAQDVSHLVVPMDIDLDGTKELGLFDSEHRMWSFGRRAAEPGESADAGDRVVGVVDGQGRHTSFAWSTGAETRIATNDPASSYPIRPVNVHRPVVASMGDDAALGGEAWTPRTTRYRYGGRRVDVLREVQLGPHVSESTVELKTKAGVMQTRSLSRTDSSAFEPALGTYPLSGAPVAGVKVVRNLTDTDVPARVTHVGRQWSWVKAEVPGGYRRRLDDQHTTSWDAPKLEPGNIDCLLKKVADPGGCLPQPWTGHPLSAEHKSLGYDAYGNLSDETTRRPLDFGLPPEESTVLETSVHREFENHPQLDDYVLGLPTWVTTASLTPGGNEYRQVRSTYDKRHLLEASTVEPNRKELTVRSRYVRNASGAVTEEHRKPGDGDEQLVSRTVFDTDATTALSVENAKGQKTHTTEHPLCGLPAAVTNPAGVTQTTDVDGFCRPAGGQRFHGQVALEPHTEIKRARIVNGDAVFTDTTTSVDGAGVVGRVRSDALERPVTEMAAGFGDLDVEVHRRYDVAGDLVRKSVPTSSGKDPVWWALTTFDHLGRTIYATSPKGALTKVTYKRTTETRVDPAGRKRIATSDPAGRLVRSEQVGDKQTPSAPRCYSYGPFDVLLRSYACHEFKVADDFTYDPLGRQTSHHSPQGGTSTTTYDPFGRVDVQTDGTGLKTKYRYDALDRVVERTERFGTDQAQTAVWTWDTVVPGGLTSSTSADGKIVETPSYDAQARPSGVTRTVDGQPLQRALTYDTRGRVATRTYPTDAGIAPLVVASHYNDRDQLQSLSISSKNGDQPVWSATKGDQFDNRVAQRWFNKTQTNSVYDGRSGELLQQATTNYATDKTIATDTWDWSSTGDLRARARTTPGAKRKESFKYDALDQLRSWTTSRPVIDATVTTTMAYDALGNITSTPTGATAAYDPKSQLLQSLAHPNQTHTAYEYDTAGRLKLRTRLDAANVPTAATAIDYTPTGQPAALVMTSLDPDLPAAKTAQTFRYTADGGQAVQDGPDGRLLNLGETTVTRTDPEHTTVATTIVADGAPVARHVATVTGQQPAKSTLTAIHPADAQGTTTLTTGPTSKATYLHTSPWGQATSTDWTKAVSTDHPDPESTSPGTGYTGHETRSSDGFITMGDRLYDPGTGRFAQPDSVTPDAANQQDWNRTTYTRNNPLRYVDPDGHAPAGIDPNGLPGPGRDVMAGESNPIDLADIVLSEAGRPDRGASGASPSQATATTLNAVLAAAETHLRNTAAAYLGVDASRVRTSDLVRMVQTKSASLAQQEKARERAIADFAVKVSWGNMSAEEIRAEAATLGPDVAANAEKWIAEKAIPETRLGLMATQPFVLGVGKVPARVVSRLRTDNGLVRHARAAGENEAVQRGIDHLKSELARGNMPDAKPMGDGITEVRNGTGARLYVRAGADNTIEILGISSKANQQAVIDRVRALFGR